MIAPTEHATARPKAWMVLLGRSADGAMRPDASAAGDATRARAAMVTHPRDVATEILDFVRGR